MSVGQNIKKLRESRDMTQKELGDLLGISDKTVSSWESEIRTPRMGVIQKLSDCFHILKSEIIDDSIITIKNIGIPYNPTHRIPILGHISAGLPLYADEHIEGYTYTDFNDGSEYFALRVSGDSMNDSYIFNGNILIVRKQESVENGEIAVVLVDNENATVKRFYQNDNIVTLVPQSTNPLHRIQAYDLNKVEICVLGKVVENKIFVK